MLIPRIIGVKTCNVCPTLIENFKEFGFAYEYLDANDKNNKKIMDEFNIDVTPVVQIIDKDTKEVKHSFFPGAVTPKAIVHKIADIEGN